LDPTAYARMLPLLHVVLPQPVQTT
jgi:hypothetical protein